MNRRSILAFAAGMIGLESAAAFGQSSGTAPPQAVVFMIFFDWERSTLSAQALSTVKQSVAASKARNAARLTVVGHTDASHDDGYSMALSLRRANAVKEALVAEGVVASTISVVGRGKTQLLVPTADGVREPQNRRAEIVIS